MKRALKIICLSLAISIVLLSASIFAACSKRELIGIEIRKNSFRDKYAVDEELNLSTSFLKLNYSSGDVEEIRITEEMVFGFDTETTGSRTMYIEYKGFRTEEISYSVYNPENASRQILTGARLNFFTQQTSTGTQYSIFLDSGDMNAVRALQFTLESEQSLEIESDCSNVSVTPANENTQYYITLSAKRKLQVLVYSDGGDLPNGTLLKLSVNNGYNTEIQLSNITVSDGEQDYYLPKVEW